MSLPINPNTTPVPNFTPSGPQPGGFTPLEKLLIDSFAPSIGSILPTPPVDASNPEISMAEFFSSVSAAQLKQKLQDYINSINDPLLRQKLLDEVANRAGTIADLINIIVQYRELLFRLTQLDLQGKQKKLNDAIDAFTANSTQDVSHVTDINNAITAYNTAQTQYQGALTTYQGALTTFTAAQQTYNGALTTWNTALNNFHNGSLTQAQLETARGIFNTAQTVFNGAKTTMNGATTTFNVAKTNWLAAQSNLTTKTTQYNDYVTQRNQELAGVIGDFNAAVQTALPIVTDLNSIRDFLFGGSPLEPPSDFSGSTGLEPFDMGTPGPDTLRNQVQGVLDTSNGAATSINTLTGQVTSIITTINAGGYNPPLVPPSPLIPIPNLPTENSNFVLNQVQFTPPSKDNFDFGALFEFDTSFLDTMLKAVNQYNTTSDAETHFQNQITDQLATFVQDLPDQAVGVGSSVSVSANSASIGGRSNPHLLGALSKHVFETVLDVFGVPAGSPLVDQMGALFYGYRDVVGLLSIVPAKEILGDNTIPPGPLPLQSVNAAVALGTISQVQNLVSSDQITQDITRIVNADATLASLTPEAKTALIQTLVQEVGASLIKAALNQLAASIDLPGLVAQILAHLTTLQAPGAPEPNLKDIVSQVILSQELARQLNISRTVAEDIVRNAIRDLALKNQAITQDAVTQAILDQIRADQALNSAVSASAARDSVKQDAISEDALQTQISADEALKSDIRQSVVKADEASSTRIQAENDRTDRVKRDTFLNALADELESHQVDPAKIKKLLHIYTPTVLNALISGLIKPNFLEALTNHLIKLPITLQEANSVVKTSITKASEKDASLNPLSTFIGNHVLGLNDLSALFKSQVANILSPVVGQGKALEVAENYGRLIFADPNSATKLLERNEKSLSTKATYNFNARVFEDYRNAAQVFINPAAAPGNPLHEANVLLLSGQAAGISVQGTTSADNKLGPLAYHNKNPIELPG